ncbi:MAG TPA: glutamine--fructose-6-phosphate aminotransferase, partial [Ottowia sp.]|nr:glutamine--fructose-6-phosphate aminotransferase [Ottowia sp.]
MCGIVGAVATRNIVPILVQGLQRLEYRGYDSCGIAVNTAGVAPPPVRLRRVRGISRVADLAAQAAEQGVEGHIGIAHTRWATHGAPAVSNAHPHFSMGAHGGELAGDAADDARGRVTLVHNGIIENHETLRRELEARGYHFSSQTDTEVIVHLIDSLYDGDLFEAVQAAARQLHGSFAIAVLHRDEPQRLVGARQGSPLVLGVGADGKEHFLASDAMALAGVTDQIAYLEDGDVVDVQLGKHWIVGAGGQRVQRAVKTVQVASGAAELGP